MEDRYEVVGIMSGSSLDGMDLARCEFTHRSGSWSYGILEARTVPYDESLKSRLVAVMEGSALDLARLHRDLGDAFGNECKAFLAGRSIDLIASHGHTVFHKPDENLTTQLGCGARIAAITGVPTVSDFRTMDVARGGQGAPLVPLGERLLFPEYGAFLNIGGICNIAIHGQHSVVGYDVCIGNQALNRLAEETGASFDHDGVLARSGMINEQMLGRLNDLPFHRKAPPKSLGREWFAAEVEPILLGTDVPLADRLRTAVEHIAIQLSNSARGLEGALLVTGGGTHNTFLMERVRMLSATELVLPEPSIIDFKEALIFAFLGVRRLRGESTSLANVTGALRDSVGGALYAPN